MARGFERHLAILEGAYFGDSARSDEAMPMAM